VSAAGTVAESAVVPEVQRELVAAQIVEVLGVDSCTYADGPPTGAHPRLQRDGSVTRGGHPVDVDRSGLPTDDVLELPLERGGLATGRFVVVAASQVVWPTLEQRQVAVVLADIAAGAAPRSQISR
jgi:hypothetical protein